MTKIKLCGLSRPEDIEAANGLSPEYIGFVFAPGSKRYVSPETARHLRAMLDGSITPVGVFVDADVNLMADLADSGVIDAIQLHGHETNDVIKRLRSMSDAVIIQAFRIASKDDTARASMSHADYVLLDAGTGCGKTFDWSLVSSMDREWFLAGGLTPDNVHDALSGTKPWAVDVSSGIETDRVKDPDKMRAFVRAVRSFC